MKGLLVIQPGSATKIAGRVELRALRDGFKLVPQVRVRMARARAEDQSMLVRGRVPNDPIHVFDGTNLRKEWVTACAAAGVGTLTEVEGRPYDPLYSGLTLHDLRRSAVRNLVNAGVPERVAMKITEHKTRSVFDRYHIVSTEDVTDAMQAVDTASLAALRNDGRKALGN
jgi:hypothetical protein